MRNINLLQKAIASLRPNADFWLNDDIVSWGEGTADIPNELEIQIAYENQVKEYPMRLLRLERNQRLQQTDWRMTTDYPYSDQDQWASYRTSLRNLPATAEPTLDEQGNLIVDWPQAPDAV